MDFVQPYRRQKMHWNHTSGSNCRRRQKWCINIMATDYGTTNHYLAWRSRKVFTQNIQLYIFLYKHEFFYKSFFFRLLSSEPPCMRPHFGGRLSSMIHSKNKSSAVWGDMGEPAHAVIFNGVWRQNLQRKKKKKIGRTIKTFQKKSIWKLIKMETKKQKK